MSKLSKFLVSASAAAVVAGGFTVVSTAPASAAAPTLRVVANPTDVTDAAGNVWKSDRGFTGGYQVTDSASTQISGTGDDALYRAERWGMSGWKAQVPNGTYQVTLKTAENYFTYRGARVFSITAEGSTKVKNLDIFNDVGKNAALDKVFTVKVSDGELNLGFSATRNNAKIAAIQVVPVDGGGVSPTPRPTNSNPSIPTTAPSTAPTTTAPTTTAPTTTAPTTTAPTTTAPTSTGTWLSGSSGVGAANGDFGRWRGRDLDIVASWAGDADNSANFYQLQRGAEFGSWNGSMDMAVGGIDAGETWSQAASGQLDARWRQSLTKLKSSWSGRSGTMYIRFAHEMNGYWFPWSVNSSNYQDFMTSWKRYRALQQQVFPEAKLVFSVNKESNGTNMDWTKFFPGKQYVDVLSVDYYNNWPYAATLSDFQNQSWDKDGYGAPKGINAHLAYAKSQGLPLSVSEWSGNADDGDSPAYVQGMYDFFKANGGTGAGKLIYEVQFNVDIDGHRWLLTGGTRMPQSASKYKDLF